MLKGMILLLLASNWCVGQDLTHLENFRKGSYLVGRDGMRVEFSSLIKEGERKKIADLSELFAVLADLESDWGEERVRAAAAIKAHLRAHKIKSGLMAPPILNLMDAKERAIYRIAALKELSKIWKLGR